MEKIKIHMIGNTHIDPVWLWTRAEGMQEVKSSFMSALDRLDEFPDFIFTQSSVGFLAWMKEHCPRQFERIKKYVAEGRWEIVGGMWIEPDCDLPSGESFIRHFLFSQQFVQENFGRQVTTAYNVDSFGHGANLPAICSRCGIKYYLMSRPDRKHVELPPVFLWKSPDGSSVIAERTGGEYMAWTRPALEWNLEESLEALKTYDYDKMAVFYGVGNHGGGPTIENIRTIYEMRDEYTDLEMDFSSMEKFFTSVESDQLPERMQEMGRIFWGCYSSDRQIKELNRKAEWTLLKAEAIVCMAREMGAITMNNAVEQLEVAWKEVLFNQFHDILAGTSIEPARNDACQEFCRAIATGRQVIQNGIQAIVNQVDTRGDGFSLILVNPTGHNYEGMYCAHVYVPRAPKKYMRLKNCKGQEIPYCETLYKNCTPESRKGIIFEAKVPAFGYAIYRMTMEAPENMVSGELIRAEEHLLDNGVLQVVFDEASGCPSSIMASGRELLEESAAFSVYYDDRGAWGETIYQEKKMGAFRVKKCQVIEANQMRAILRYVLDYERSEMVVDYLLEKGSDQLKVSIKLQNTLRHRQITLDLPVAVKDPQVWNETAFLAENKTDCQDENTEYYQHRFADITGTDGSGLAVINNGIYSFRQVGNTYKLMLSRSAGFARGAGGPLPEDLDGPFMDQGTFEYELVMIAHDQAVSHKRLFMEADFMHMPVEYLGDSNHTGQSHKRTNQVLDTSLENVAISALKCPHDGSEGIILRLYETEGGTGYARLECFNRTLELEFTPYEIKTIRLSRQAFSCCDMLEQ